MNILVPDISIVEKVLRAGAVYAFLLVAFRLCGKRQLGAYLTFRFKRVDRVVEHSLTVLIRHGRIIRDNLRRERLGPRDLRAALRHHGGVSRRDIRYAFLEEDGHVSVVTRRPTGE